MAEKAKFDREAAFKSIIGAGRQSENAVAAEEKNGKKKIMYRGYFSYIIFLCKHLHILSKSIMINLRNVHEHMHGVCAHIGGI